LARVLFAARRPPSNLRQNLIWPPHKRGISFYIAFPSRGSALTDRSLLQQTAARIAEIASDCFDRPTTERLRQLGQELEKRLQSEPLASSIDRGRQTGGGITT
jgi:hypothetical protein